MKRRQVTRPVTMRVAVAAIRVLDRRVSKLERAIRGSRDPIGFTMAHGDEVELDSEETWEIDTTETCRRGR